MQDQPMVHAQMMIRRPVSEVFEAFINPEITTNFWFTHSSGRLEEGKQIFWEWRMYGAKAAVHVKEIIAEQKIIIQWGDPATTVEFWFKSIAKDQALVEIKNYGFHQTGQALINAIVDSTGGFTTVLDGLKAWLEYGLKLNLIADKFPQA